MTVDERIDRLTERHEALTQSIELLTLDVRDLTVTVKRTAESVDALVRIVFDHERRIGGLEGA